MANLKKREIIFLVIAALVVLYAGYEYLIAGPASKKVKTTATSVDSVNINNSVSELTNDLTKDKLSDFDAYVIKRMKADWQKNPFWEKKSYKEWVAREGAASGSSKSAKIIYSGYVISEKNRMAVINGLEYRIGEELEIEGYVLKQITPLNVLIFDKNTGSKVEIPLQE